MFVKEMGKFVLTAGVIGLAAHFLGEGLPRSWFHYNAAPWRAFRWEREGKIYRRVGIARWKDHLPDASRHASDMVRKRLEGDRTAEHLLRLVQETCVAECVHWLLWLVSPVLLAVMKRPWSVAAALLYGLSNLPFILIQRYNRPRLARLYERAAERETIKQMNEEKD